MIHFGRSCVSILLLVAIAESTINKIGLKELYDATIDTTTANNYSNKNCSDGKEECTVFLSSSELPETTLSDIERTELLKPRHLSMINSDANMKLLEEFDEGVKHFVNNPLHIKLRTNTIGVEEKLVFLPKMLFFVLGFKDLMHLMKYAHPQTPEERAVNAHSEDDDYHWNWYLQDLTYLNTHLYHQEDDSSKTDCSSSDTYYNCVGKIWNDDLNETRRTIYMFAHHILNVENASARMLMIEVLEATFHQFKNAIHPILKTSDLYDHLDYFGKKHEEVEASHDMGLDEDDVLDIVTKIPNKLKVSMRPIVKLLFNQMHQMTSEWAEFISIAS